MTTDPQASRFKCPRCGHKHAADLSPMEGHPELHGKVPCASCHTMLWLSLDDQGATRVEIYEEHLHDVLEKKAAEVRPPEPATPSAAPGANAAGGTPLIATVLAAAVIAAIVSLVMGGVKSTKSDTVQSAGSNPALERGLEDLQSQLATAIGIADKAREELGQSLSTLETAVARNAEALAQAPGRSDGDAAPGLSALETQLQQVLANYEEFNGRIEANYTQLRLALKRLEALESK